MATTFFLRNIPANDPAPAAKASSDTDSFTVTGRNTPLRLALQAGSSDVSVGQSFTSPSNPSYAFMRMFVSDPLLPGQTITGAQSLTFGIGINESSNSMNLYHRWFVYVRSSAGANSKTIYGPTSDPTEENSGRKGCTHSVTSAASNYTTAKGDRIVVELWLDLRNTSTYTGTIYFDGPDAIVENTAYTPGTGQGSYFQFTDDIQFDWTLSGGGSGTGSSCCNFI